MAVGYWQGANQFFSDRRDKKAADERFMAEQLTRTKEIVIPELLRRLDDQRTRRSTRKARVSSAVGLGFSRDTAIALEKSGQLERQIGRINELDKKGKLNTGYVELLDNYIRSKVESNEDLLNAVAQGLDSNSFVTEDEQLEGLLKAVSSTNEEDFSSAVKLLQPSEGKQMIPVDLFDYGKFKGRNVTQTERNKIISRLGVSLADNLDKKYEVMNTGEGVFLRFTDPQVNTFLSEVADNIIKYDLAVDNHLTQETLIEEATDLVQGLPNAFKGSGFTFASADPGQPFGLGWAGSNFADAFALKIQNPDREDNAVWSPFIRIGPNQPPPLDDDDLSNLLPPDPYA